MFDPSDTWSNGSLFEKALADFFATRSLKAQIIATRGGTERRVVFIEPMDSQIAQNLPEPKSKPATEQIKQVQNKPLPQGFKKFIKKIPQQVNNSPKLDFKKGSSDLRRDVQKLPHMRFRRIKHG